MDSSSTLQETESEEEVETPVPTTGSVGVSGTKRKKKAHSPSTPRTRSKVWKHFTRIEGDINKCKCHYCGRKLGCATKSGTSNLSKHLKTCKQHMAWRINKGKQQAITPEGSLMLAKVSEEVFREATNEMLVLGELPLSFVESLAWRHFCSRVNLYNPHSRRTATRDIMELYVKRKNDMRDIFRKCNQRVSFDDRHLDSSNNIVQLYGGGCSLHRQHLEVKEAYTRIQAHWQSQGINNFISFAPVSVGLGDRKGLHHNSG